MTNFDTIQAITDNLQSVLKGLGAHFSRKSYENEAAIPAGLIPYGEIYYMGEEFEDASGQKPEYSDARFLLKVIIRERDDIDAMREAQKWVHLTRDALTVDALHIGAIAASKEVSRVTTEGAEVEYGENHISILRYQVLIRYREV